MSAIIFVIFFAQAVLVQFALTQCAGRSNLGDGLPPIGLGSTCTDNTPSNTAPILTAPFCASGAPGNGIYGARLGFSSPIAVQAIPTSGGALPLSSTSTLAPTGLSISSQNVFEGSLSVIGELPFVSAVALEGVLPSAGVGAVSYSCGNGVSAIQSIVPGAVYGPGPAIAPAGYGLAVASTGFPLGSAACNAPAIDVVAPVSGCDCKVFEY